jgi:acyl-homoserine lactone synthase
LTVHCIDHGITRLSWLTHQKFYNLVQKVWDTEPLGLPRREDGDWAWIPAVSRIDQATLDRQLDRFRNAEAIVEAYMAPKLAAARGRVA